MIPSDVIKHIVLDLKKEELLLDENSKLLVVPSLVIIPIVSALLLGDDNNCFLLECKEVIVGNIVVAEGVVVKQVIAVASLRWPPGDTPGS
jgi:hypothetical protein